VFRRPREVGEISARINSHPDSRWIIQLWLEPMDPALEVLQLLSRAIRILTRLDAGT
jgi:hypothetical protein